MGGDVESVLEMLFSSVIKLLWTPVLRIAVDLFWFLIPTRSVAKQDRARVVLHDKTLFFITTARVAEIEGGSTFYETCLTAEVQKGFMKATMLRCKAS